MMTVQNGKPNRKVSYRNVLKFSREKSIRNRHHVKVGYNNNKQNKYKRYDNDVKGMESDKFDDVLDKDINFYTTRLSSYQNSSNLDTKPSRNVETVRRLNLIKIAKFQLI